MSSQMVEVPNLPYTFNPPPHPSTFFYLPDDYAQSIYDENGNVYNLGSPEEYYATFGKLRLGRMVMWDQVLSYALLDANTRYGFRFLYNPTTLSGSQSVGTDFIPDPSSSIGGMLQDGLEQINFQLILNRTPEVQGNAQPSDYATPISDADMEQLRKRGTHYDVEFMYRIANGVHNTNYRQGTGDIGVLLPNPIEMYIGPYRSRGSLMQLSVTDQMFSANMVPMLSYVQVTFSRYLSFIPTEEELDRLGSSGVTIPGMNEDGTVDPGTGSTDPGAGSSGSNEGQPANGNNVDAPIPGYNVVTTGWKYSSGSAHGAWDYGSGGVNEKIVKTTRAGTVDRVKTLSDSYGWHVVIRTGDVYHYYCHLSEINSDMEVGRNVDVGAVVGRVGSTGNSSGPHLHYEERQNDQQHSRHPQWGNRQPGDIPGGA